MLKQIVVLLLVAVCLASCQDRGKERQKIMAEIERLDLLREKVKEFVPEQEAALSAKKIEYAERKSGYLDRLKPYEQEIRMTEMVLGDLGGYLALLKKNTQNDWIRGEIRETQKESKGLQDKLARLRKAHDSIKKETVQSETVFLKQIIMLESDLRITQATYDSLNALHTIEVGKLARFGGE